VSEREIVLGNSRGKRLVAGGLQDGAEGCRMELRTLVLFSILREKNRRDYK